MSISKTLATEFIGTFWPVLGGGGGAMLVAAFPNVRIGQGRYLAVSAVPRTGASLGRGGRETRRPDPPQRSERPGSASGDRCRRHGHPTSPRPAARMWRTPSGSSTVATMHSRPHSLGRPTRRSQTLVA
jgi:hypothetical protein